MKDNHEIGSICSDGVRIFKVKPAINSISKCVGCDYYRAPSKIQTSDCAAPNGTICICPDRIFVHVGEVEDKSKKDLKGLYIFLGSLFGAGMAYIIYAIATLIINL